MIWRIFNSNWPIKIKNRVSEKEAVRVWAPKFSVRRFVDEPSHCHEFNF